MTSHLNLVSYLTTSSPIDDMSLSIPYPVNQSLEESNSTVAPTFNNQSFVTLTLVFGTLVTLVGIFSNTLIIISSTSHRKRKDRNSKTACFITSLAVTDLFCMLLMIGYILYMVCPSLRTKLMHDIFSSFQILFCTSSQLHTVAISLERLVAVLAPMRHRVIVTQRRVCCSIVMLWIISMTLFVAAILRLKAKSELYAMIVFWLLITVAFVIPVVIVVSAYAIIAIIGYRNVQKRKYQKRTLTEKLRLKELRVLMITSVMIVPMLTVWTVFFVGTMYETFTEKSLPGIMNWLLTFLPFLACAVDPFLYMLGTRSLTRRVTRRITSFVRRSLLY